MTSADPPTRSRVGLTALSDLATALDRRLPRIDPDDQDAMVQELLPGDEAFGDFIGRFASLIVLSASIAAFGLLADSSAVVIGAMLVAPLMTPILATAAAVCTSDDRRLSRALLVLLGGTVLAILTGFVVAVISGNTIVSADDLPDQVLSRTSPGLLDLGIAVTAGAAAGYVAPRRAAVSALPGVGIAVALVPPLAAVGVTLEAGAGHEAQGALLLYLTNLAAIVFAGALVLLLSGVRPRQGSAVRRMRVGLMVTVGAVLAVAVPLTLHTIEVLEDTGLERDVTRAIRDWDDDVEVIELTADVDDGVGRVELRIESSSEPEPAWLLADLIADRHGAPVELSLAVVQTTSEAVSVR